MDSWCICFETEYIDGIQELGPGCSLGWIKWPILRSNGGSLSCDPQSLEIIPTTQTPDQKNIVTCQAHPVLV